VATGSGGGALLELADCARATFVGHEFHPWLY
jgi:hypothetical protein